MCGLLWETPDDPRAALRWSLTKLRAALDDEDHRRIVAGKETVALDLHGARVDFVDAREGFIGGGLSAETLEKIANDLRGGSCPAEWCKSVALYAAPGG